MKISGKEGIKNVLGRIPFTADLYWLVRQKVNKNTDGETDIWAIERGNISITPLHTDLLNRPSPPIPNSLCSNLLQELQQY